MAYRKEPAGGGLRGAWRELVAEIELCDAMLYADEPCARALAAAIGLPALLERGVRNVLPLGSLPAGTVHDLGSENEDPPTRAVIFCATPLPQAYASIRAALQQPGTAWRDVAILASVTDAEHNFAEQHDHAGSTSTPRVPNSALERCKQFVVDCLNEVAQVAAQNETTSNAELARGSGCATSATVTVTEMPMPMQACPLGDSTFLLPSPDGSPTSDLASLLPIDLEPSAAMVRTAEATSCASNAPRHDKEQTCVAQDELLASQLSRLLGALSVRPTIYAMGERAIRVGGHMVSSESEAEMSAKVHGTDPSSNAATTTPLSLVLLDRSLDLVAPSMPHLHPLSLLLSAEGAHPSDIGLDGVLHSLDASTAHIFEALLSRRPQEVNLHLLRALMLAAEAEGVELRIPPRPSADEIRKLVAFLRKAFAVGTLGEATQDGDPDGEQAILKSDGEDGKERTRDEDSGRWVNFDSLARCAPTLRAIEALLSPLPTKTEEDVSNAKVLMHTAAEDPPSAFAQLQQLIARTHPVSCSTDENGVAASHAAPSDSSNSHVPRQSHTPLLELRSHLALLVLTYSLLGTAVDPGGNFAVGEAQQRLRQTMVQALLRAETSRMQLEDVHLSEPPTATHARVTSIVEHTFALLRAVANGRGALDPKFSTLLTPSAQSGGDVYQPLIRLLLSRVMRDEEVPGLARLTPVPSSNLKTSFLSRGASLLLRSRGHRPAEHSNILLFVVGSVSLMEVREARQLAAVHPNHSLMIGATGLASPFSIARDFVDAIGSSLPG